MSPVNETHYTMQHIKDAQAEQSLKMSNHSSRGLDTSVPLAEHRVIRAVRDVIAANRR